MTFQPRFKTFALVGLITIGMSACGGGGGGGSGYEDPVDPPAPPPAPVAVDFGKTVSDLVGPDASTTLPDGNTFDAEGSPIEVPDYMWDIDDADVDESNLDDVFSG